MAPRPLTAVPQQIYVETSVFVGAVIQGPTDSRACLQFTEQLSAANSQVVFSELTRVEFANAVAEVARSSRRRLELPADMVKEYSLDNGTLTRPYVPVGSSSDTKNWRPYSIRFMPWSRCRLTISCLPTRLT